MLDTLGPTLMSVRLPVRLWPIRRMAMEPRTLVLNSWMKPHGIVTWQQAICLVDILAGGRCIVVGKADVLEAYAATVSSPSVTIAIPAVIRLRREMVLFKSGVKFSRAN